MPIKIIQNGYFRSGTTFMRDYLMSQLPGHLCFDECLHPNLASYIRNEQRTNEKSILQEYLNFGVEFLNKVLLNHPNFTQNGIYNERAFVDFFDVFNELHNSVLIKENRAHFFLNVFFDRYQAKVIHLIRHPLDVFFSIEDVYFSSSSLFKRSINRLIKPLIFRDFFEIFKEYHWIKNHTGYPYTSPYNWEIKCLRKNKFIDKFLVVWTISNYYALKSIEKNRGLLIVYEDMLNHPKKIQQQLSDYLKIEFLEPPEVKKDNYFKFRKSMIQKLSNIVSLYKIDKEFDYVIQKIKEKSGIDYL